MHKIFCALKVCALKVLFWNFFLIVAGLVSNQIAATFITHTNVTAYFSHPTLLLLGFIMDSLSLHFS